MDAFVERYDVHKIAALRRVCIVCGIQLFAREYAMDTRTARTFSDDDVLLMYPVVKHIAPRANDATQYYHLGQQKIQAGQLRHGYELIVESLNLLNSVYGAMHAEIAQCMRLLARLAYILGDAQEALAHQTKATQMSERCNGIDAPQTINEYISLAHYSFANLQISTALRLLYRARYLMLLVIGERHPLMAQIDVSRLPPACTQICVRRRTLVSCSMLCKSTTRR
jgi:protein TIF31